ncbi:MAG: tRNA (adenosine(37)-N6)-threonylcarbamoyltransferase complex dimerization subunit type 1 TsaB, partial [Propionibacteriaceae bacterium]
MPEPRPEGGRPPTPPGGFQSLALPEPGLVLALDTTTDVTVGVARGTDVLVSERVTDRMAHVEQLMPLVHRSLAAAGASLADVAHVVVGLGPGPFTGLRVGIVTAQVLAHVRGLPLHGVCSLDVIAAAHLASAHPTTEFVVATDARRKELYWARYGADGRRVGEPEVSRPDDVPRLPSVGPGADLYADPAAVGAVAGPVELLAACVRGDHELGRGV